MVLGPDASDSEQPITPTSNTSKGQRRGRRKRLRLSCLECRRKKLSCDRNLPCRRCVRTGRSDECSFDTITGRPPIQELSAQTSTETQIRDLQIEVARLKELLAKVTRENENGGCQTDITHTQGDFEPNQIVTARGRAPDTLKTSQASRYLVYPTYYNPWDDENSIKPSREELLDPRERSSQGYYSRHSLFRFFAELGDLFTFIKETSDEWFKPNGVHLVKHSIPKPFKDANNPLHKDDCLENLLPSREDTDALVSFYLNHLEQLHRVLHVPTFRTEYANFWSPEAECHPAMTPLVLVMISISACTFSGSNDPAAISTRCQMMPSLWISACEMWLAQQGTKHRKIVHYQISCLLYLAKRRNLMGKKGYWKDTASLLQNAIIDGLHNDSSPNFRTPYMQEMKRRLWMTIRELDLQNCYEHGLPTLLHSISSSTAPPANLSDEDFDETSQTIPEPKPLETYTNTSYQLYSSRSWDLRLEISQRLFSTRMATSINYNDVLKYTHKLTQAMDALPCWPTIKGIGTGLEKESILAYVFLQSQLQECILVLHRPYTQLQGSKFRMSETVCYQTSRDVLQLNLKLQSLGLSSLTMLRPTLFLASLSLVRIGLMQDTGLLNDTLINSKASIDLLEQSVTVFEDEYVCSCSGEPWCFMTMCAAIKLWKIHLGIETRDRAKASCGQRFLELRDKRMGHDSRSAKQIATIAQLDSGLDNQDVGAISTADLLDNNYAEPVPHSFDFSMDFEGIWNSWDPSWLESPVE